MRPALEPHVADAYAADVRGAMTRRVLLGVSFLVGVTAISGLTELAYYPERLGALVASFSAEMVLCLIALVASRQARLRRWIMPIVIATTIGVAVCIVAYVVYVGASADAAAQALSVYLMGAALLYPWGLRGQVPLVIGVVGAFLCALAAGIPRHLPLTYDIIGVAGGATTSIIGALFLDRSRRAIFHQRVLLERTRDRQMAMLYHVTRTVTSTLDVQQVLRLVCQSVLEALRLERLWLVWRDTPEGALAGLEARRHGDEVSLTAVAGDPARWEGLLEPVGDAGPTLVETEGRELAPLGASAAAPTRLLRLPLRFRGEPVGTILADCSAERPELPANFLDLAATLGNSAAMAIANARLHALVVEHRAALQRLSNKRLDLVEEAMRRISHELHDGTCQALMAVSLELALLDRHLRSETLPVNVRDVRARVLDVMHGVRQMSHLIHPPVLDDFGVVAAVESIAAKYREAQALDVRVENADASLRFAPAIELLLLRVFQEAMSNIVRHAGAKTVAVRLRLTDGALALEVQDDGRGFDAQAYFRSPPPGAGLGLIGMRERVAHFGGTFALVSRAGRGTRLEVRVPAAPVAHGGSEVATAV
jgi:signal transduction histidine kinase